LQTDCCQVALFRYFVEWCLQREEYFWVHENVFILQTKQWLGSNDWGSI
jgi:2-iminoacetate synthase ThiH